MAIRVRVFYCDPLPQVPKLIANSPEEVLRRMRRMDSRELQFQTMNLGHPRDVSFISFYQLHHQRYSIYMEIEKA